MPRTAFAFLIASTAAALSLAPTAAEAKCKLTKHFRVVQKDGFTVDFQKSSGQWSASTDGYGTAPTELFDLTRKGFQMFVHWQHGELGVYTFRFMDKSDFGFGSVVTPDRHVNPVSFRSIDPLRTCN